MKKGISDSHFNVHARKIPAGVLFAAGGAIGVLMAMHTLSGVKPVSTQPDVNIPKDTVISYSICSTDATQQLDATIDMGYTRHLPSVYADVMGDVAKTELDKGMNAQAIGQEMLAAGLAPTARIAPPTLSVSAISVTPGCRADTGWSMPQAAMAAAQTKAPFVRRAY